MCTMLEFRVQGCPIGPDEATIIYRRCGAWDEDRYSWTIGPFDDLRDVYLEARKIMSAIHEHC